MRRAESFFDQIGKPARNRKYGVGHRFGDNQELVITRVHPYYTVSRYDLTCPAGHVFVKDRQALKQGKVKRCPVCAKAESITESSTVAT